MIYKNFGANLLNQIVMEDGNIKFDMFYISIDLKNPIALALYKKLN